jgi:hypothetical protein
LHDAEELLVAGEHLGVLGGRHGGVCVTTVNAAPFHWYAIRSPAGRAMT